MKLFYILGPYPNHVPYDFVKQYEEQAKKNHCGQDIARLNERGGLSWKELYYVINGMDFNEDGRANEKDILFRHLVLLAINEWVCKQNLITE